MQFIQRILLIAVIILTPSFSSAASPEPLVSERLPFRHEVPGSTVEVNENPLSKVATGLLLCLVCLGVGVKLHTWWYRTGGGEVLRTPLVLKQRLALSPKASLALVSWGEGELLLSLAGDQVSVVMARGVRLPHAEKTLESDEISQALTLDRSGAQWQ